MKMDHKKFVLEAQSPEFYWWSKINDFVQSNLNHIPGILGMYFIFDNL